MTENIHAETAASRRQGHKGAPLPNASLAHGMAKRISGILFYLLFTVSVTISQAESGGATSYYVSPTGLENGNGSISNPWTLVAALDLPSRLKAGDTLYLRAGVYKAPFPEPFRIQFVGARLAPITIRPYPGEQVTIDGNLEVVGPGITIRDLEITSSVSRRKIVADTPAPGELNTNPGVNVLAANVKVINCVIHDLGGGVGAWSSAPDTEIYGNVVYYNGWSAADRPHGHGVYAQNESGSKIIEDNIIHDNFGQGIQVYGSKAASLKNIRLSGNIVFENGSMTGQYSRNILVGGGNVATNLDIRNNYTSYERFGDNVNLGHYPDGGGCANAVFVNNYIAGGTVSFHNCRFSDISGNIITGELRPGPPSLFPANVYGPQATASVFVRPNRHETGRAHVVIYNPAQLPKIAVDLAPLNLEPGDRIQIRNAQDYYGDVTTAVFTGGLLQFKMTAEAVAKPVGWNKPSSTFPTFGAFVVQKIGSEPRRTMWMTILLTGMLLALAFFCWESRALLFS